MSAVCEQVRVFAPAKINWILTIRGRRPDGYHDLDTVFQALNWGDELICRRLRVPRCRLLCDAPGVPLGDDNLVARAWRLLREAFGGRVGGLEVRLLKRIPVGAGLGGGSSDAVAALRAVDRLYGLGLSADRLAAFAARLGSDCPFFVRGGAALATGRGERLRPLVNRLPPVWLVLVFPGFPSSTAEAYRRVRPVHYRDGSRARRLAAALEQGRLGRLQKLTYNAFSLLVSEVDIRYKVLQDYIIRERLSGPLLAGSGSAMFAFASDRIHGRRAAQRLRRYYPLAEAITLRHGGVRVMPRRRGLD
jgi:4-diphosphocytidyl-2-C-methyl-D-erythritol kinase